MKTAIFVIGEKNSGKTSVIRALTGQSGNNHCWYVMSRKRRKIPAFVITSALQEDKGTKKIPLNDDFLKNLEKRYKIKKENCKYELLICPLEINVRKPLHTFNEYLDFFINLNLFKVKVAIIRGSWREPPADNNLLNRYNKALNFVREHHLDRVVLKIYNSDEHLEANKLRRQLYPD